ncbi:unnamed protein product [Ceratitis capitata]|uniref:(Mediterranean fruit fly) hypothetical protein n=1 Tax=Ceratitis capitata TaxID=7213 RepID=A0A811UPM0_CERCA|nr:unnamed protein product [Ceratitis capitata]
MTRSAFKYTNQNQFEFVNVPQLTSPSPSTSDVVKRKLSLHSHITVIITIIISSNVDSSVTSSHCTGAFLRYFSAVGKMTKAHVRLPTEAAEMVQADKCDENCNNSNITTAMEFKCFLLEYLQITPL